MKTQGAQLNTAWDILNTEKLFIIYLESKFNWVSCILSVVLHFICSPSSAQLIHSDFYLLVNRSSILMVSVSCGKVEVYSLCTSKILLSWQVQIQVDINSGVVRPSYASSCQGRVTWAEIFLGEGRANNKKMWKKNCARLVTNIFLSSSLRPKLSSSFY